MTPSTIGHYRITTKLGAGGMGEVWRATDTKLGREVAIKILPESFAHDPDRLARFAREAQVLASLNHPNIAVIHGVEERALVMELVPGPTLAERIAHGPIPMEDAIPIALQIAEALEYAHDRGIIHRDLKPANVKITPEGRVKVLDFGLAKAMTTEAAAADPVSSPTLTMRAGASAVGMILGTAAYMSPEQARGQNVDRRADIWAFGVVLYEMLTGRTLFAEPTISDTLAAVLRADADLSALAEPVRSVVARCLRKDVRRRWQAIGDARIALDEGPEVRPPAAPAAESPRRSYWWPAAAVILALALLWISNLHFREQPPAQYQMSVMPPEKTVFTPLAAQNGGMAISPDGRNLAFLATQDSKSQLWVRRLDSASARLLPGTENAYQPFWSPDSRWIGFFTSGQLKKIEVAAGPPQVICEATTGRGGSWNTEGTIVFTGIDRTVHRVPAAGGQPVKLTALDSARQENAHYWPEFLPDGRHFIYFARSAAPGKSCIRVGAVDGRPGDPGIELAKASANARYLPPADGSGVGSSGWLLFVRDTALFAQQFDAARLKLKGDAISLTAQPGFMGNIAFANFSVSRNGVLAFSHEGTENSRLTWTTRDGKESAVVPESGAYLGPRLSPDGARLAVPMVDVAGNLDIFQIGLANGVATRFTFDPAADTTPVWSPDGKKIAFGSSREGLTHIYVKPADGAANEELYSRGNLANPGLTQYPSDWSRDGRYLLYTEIGVTTGTDLAVLDLTTPKAISFLKTPFNEALATFSPDGKWIAYTSDESGRKEIWVRSFPEGSSRFQISNNGGAEPHWRADGKELYYIAPDNKLMAVTVKSAAGIFERETPKALFESHWTATGGLIYDYDVTRDGQRFLGAVSTESSAQRPLTVLTDWQAELKH